MGLSTTVIFTALLSLAIFSESLEKGPTLLHSYIESLTGFSVIPKHMTLICYFTLNSAFARVALELVAWLSKTIVWKQIHLYIYTISGKHLAYRDLTVYKVYADIRGDSVERRRQTTVSWVRSYVNKNCCSFVHDCGAHSSKHACMRDCWWRIFFEHKQQYSKLIGTDVRSRTQHLCRYLL